jgi:pimeloyl-ACP methyl ester carboxylesterase
LKTRQQLGAQRTLSAVLVALACVGCRVPIGAGDAAWNRFAEPYRHEVDVGGYRLHYVDIGDGPPIVMIHGFADSTYTFHENARPLVEAGFRVILVDQPGLGRSELPPEPHTYSVENQANGVLRLADKLGLTRFGVAGSSMGGGICLYLSWRHPDRITRAAPLDPACFRLEGRGWMPLLNMPVLPTVATEAAGRFIVEFALRDVLYNKNQVTDAVIDEYARALNKPGYRVVLRRIIREYFSPEFDAMTRSYREVTVPQLLIWGDHDRWVPPEFGPRLQQALPNARLEVVSRCGHLPHLERPAVVNPLLIAFFSEGLPPTDTTSPDATNPAAAP